MANTIEIKNSMRLEWSLTVASIVIVYPLVAYYFWVLLAFPIGAVAMAVFLLFANYALHFYPYTPTKVRLDTASLLAIYRRGTKQVEYEDIATVRWVEDSLGGGGLVLSLKDEDEVCLYSLTKNMYKSTFERICGARPDLLFGTTRKGILVSRGGTLMDAGNRHLTDAPKKEGWWDSFSYEYFFWGRRPKKS